MFCSPFNSVRLHFHKRVAILFEPGDTDVIMIDIIIGECEAAHVEEPASLDPGCRVVGEDHRHETWKHSETESRFLSMYMTANDVRCMSHDVTKQHHRYGFTWV